ncbi:MAG: hypothetical protein OXU45_06290 [Candidatus Melainabacteria bacterium]|nr:hypothetical protein [Candidatus Melainabacteria bacterium]
MQKGLSKSLKKSIGLIQASCIPEAIKHLKLTAKQYPSNTEPLNLLAEVHIRDSGDFEAATRCLEKSIKLNDQDPNSYFYLGLCKEKDEDLQQAFECYKQAYTLDPHNGPALHCIARLLKCNKDNAASIHYGKMALQYLPNEPNLNSDLAYMCHTLGMSDEAMQYYQKCTQLDPNNKIYLASTIFIAHKLAETSLAELQIMAKQYSDKFFKRTPSLFDHSHTDSKKKLLKVGFVSADLRSHPVGYIMLSVLEKLDRSKFELHFYYNGKDYDFITEKYQACAQSFTNICAISDEEAAQQIYQDQIDILFDLSGFTGGERLGIFALKPAPVQVSHIGYFGTLGMPEIDYIIGDNILVQDGEDQFYTEKVYRMPYSHTHCDQTGVPEPEPGSPCSRNGYITFGSFNTFHKISKRVLLAWVEIIKAVPDSKLLFDSRSMLNESDLNFFKDFFIQRGITEDRLILRSNIAREDFLQSYNDVDIALDPFPYSGGTTSLEALLMGVPVITLFGNKWSGRMTSTLLENINHQELIAHSLEEYKSKLIDLANNPQAIEDYHQKLRQEVLESKLNIKHYVPAFEQAIIDMWREKSADIVK